MGRIVLNLSVIIIFISCKEEVVPVPKPRMYPRVEFPQKAYQLYDNERCDYSFEYPEYAKIVKDNYPYGNKASTDCWFNIEMPILEATIYCDYSPIENKEKFGSLIQDAFKMVGKHNIKANYREENVIHNAQQVGGLLFSISGPVATPYQFYLTDSTEHFFRASLYFNSKVNPDSMKIIHDFVKEDIDHMIKTFDWK